MTTKLPIPLPTSRDLSKWATGIVTYLRALEAQMDTPGPKIIQLEHKKADAKATTDGLLMYDATLNKVVVSVDGAWQPVVTGTLSDAPTDGRVYGRRDNAWTIVRMLLIQAEYAYNTTITAPPAAGQIRMNNVGQTTGVTTLWLSNDTAPGADLSNFLSLIFPENSIHVQDKDNGDLWRAYNMTGMAIVGASYVTLPVTYVAGGSPLIAGQRVIVSVIGQHYVP